MTLRRIPTLVLVASVLCAPRFAFASGGPPMITDDTDTPGPNGWEINTAAVFRHASSGPDLELPLVDINYGVGERIQLKYEVPWTNGHLGDSLLGVKWRFHDPGEQGWKISTYPQLELAAHGGDTSLRLPIELDREFDTFGVSLEVGRERPSDAAGNWVGGAVVSRALNEDVELLAEAHAESLGQGRESGLAGLLGARVRGTPFGTLLLSVGHEFTATDGASRAGVFGYVGWQFSAGSAP